MEREFVKGLDEFVKELDEWINDTFSMKTFVAWQL